MWSKKYFSRERRYISRLVFGGGSIFNRIVCGVESILVEFCEE